MTQPCGQEHNSTQPLTRGDVHVQIEHVLAAGMVKVQQQVNRQLTQSASGAA
jgi:hypothetical protein